MIRLGREATPPFLGTIRLFAWGGVSVIHIDILCIAYSIVRAGCSDGVHRVRLDFVSQEAELHKSYPPDMLVQYPSAAGGEPFAKFLTGPA